MTIDLLEGLTESQCSAVTHMDGPMLVLAGPGSGKTRVVTHRIAHLLSQGVESQNILALTFTNKAAEEMQSRLTDLAPDDTVWLGTFHAFCARMLRVYAHMVGLSENFSIYDTKDASHALKQAFEDTGIPIDKVTPDKVGSIISWAKNQLMTPENFVPRRGHTGGELARQIYPAYQKLLAANNAVDFDDLLMHVAVMLRENLELRNQLDNHYRYVLVDEYQDTNTAQYAIVRALSINHPNLAVTGDPDQSIYGWRGADLNNILDFEKDFPDVKVVRLEQNYRSTKRILQVADQLIANNQRRKHKTLFTENGVGEPVRLIGYPNALDEADGIAQQIATAMENGTRRASDFAIFYRVNSLSRVVEQSLRRFNIPYQIVRGLEFYQRKEVKDVLAYLHLLNNDRHDVAFQRIINMPPRGLGKVTLTKLRQHALLNNLSMLAAARDAENVDGLQKRAKTSLGNFVAAFDRMLEKVHGSLEELMGYVVITSGYQDHLESSDDEDDQQRLDNIGELISAAREFDESFGHDGGLETFLEQVALVSDTDEFEVERDQVTLMTVHAAKGLEFPCVFLIAVEEGLLPHERSRKSDAEMEEERRLMFVAVTRAEEELQISHALTRMFRGTNRHTIPSPFLMELPRDEMNVQSFAPMRQSHSWYDDSDEVSFDINDFEEEYEEDSEPESIAEQPKPAAASGLNALAGKLMTAAQLDNQSSGTATKYAADDFEHGMIVNHPEYGAGLIVGLSGNGDKRSATVRFFIGKEQTFVLKFAPLVPVRSK